MRFTNTLLLRQRVVHAAYAVISLIHVELTPKIRSGPWDDVRGVFTRVMTSTFVLPGDVVPARADGLKSLKLGPGLLQVSSGALPSAQDPIIATRAGTLNSGDNGKRWWIEKNVLRVRSLKSICARGFITHGNWQL